MSKKTSVDIIEKDHWHKYHIQDNKITFWFKGYLHSHDMATLASAITDLVADIDKIKSFLNSLDGHFALVIESSEWTLVSVDKVRSIPLFYTKINDSYHIDSHAPTLVKRSGIGTDDFDQDAILSIAMAGYTIGDKAIYKTLNSLVAGEAVFIENNKTPQRIRYYIYSPWKVVEGSYQQYLTELSEVTLNVLQKMLDSVGDRQIIIPLSAGNDSRLIVSGLKYLGAKNVKCYTYGIKGNFEAEISKIVCKILGYEWIFIPLKIYKEKLFYKSHEYYNYLKYCDTCMSIPVIRGLSTIKYLKESGWAESNAIFVNGNSGDFISGLHIKESMRKPNYNISKTDRLELIIYELIEKHFSLWGLLKESEKISSIKKLLVEEMEKVSIELNNASNDHGIYEYSEFAGRQSKYVISTQRIYEFYGFEWRLPLWDDDYLFFWEKIPLNMKAKQKLYIDMLRQQNWGNVWGNDIQANKKNISPYWINPLRFLLKILFAPFGEKGKKAWHQLEINMFYYWMDLSRTSLIIPYKKALFTLKKPKHVSSWIANKYLQDKNINFDKLFYY